MKKTFKYNGNESELLKFSRETDFNFSKKRFLDTEEADTIISKCY
nr:MAG TPA: hypothetical protein [Caudoviricetes sp.]